jgi:hypothetical protein
MSSIINQPTLSDSTIPIEKKKRGRKKQNVALEINSAPIVEEAKPLPKKRGRKPKGGKIIQENIIIESKINSEPNVILHLKCSLNDINTNDNDIETYPTKFKYNPSVENIQSFQFNNNSNMDSFLIQDTNNDGSIDNNNDILNDTNHGYHSGNISANECKELNGISNMKNLLDTGDYCNKGGGNSGKNEIWEKLNLLN